MRERSIFSKEQKCLLFDQLADCYFKRNFGTLPKAEIDLLFFRVFYHSCKERATPLSYLQMAKMLGITPGRVASLCLKVDLRDSAGENKNWRADFGEALKTARYDSKRGKIEIFFSDSLVSLEVEDSLRACNSFAELSLTKNLLLIAPEHFVKLLIHICGIDEKKALTTIAEICNKPKISANTMTDALASAFKEAGIEMVVQVLNSMLPLGIGNAIGGGLRTFCNKMKEKI